MAATAKSRATKRPAKDEWGVYDPQVAGMAALLARLEKDNAKVIPVAAAAPAQRTDIAEPAPLTMPPRPTLRDAK